MASTDDTTPTLTGEPAQNLSTNAPEVDPTGTTNDPEATSGTAAATSAPRKAAKTARKRATKKTAASTDAASPDAALADIPQPDAPSPGGSAPYAGDPDVGPPAEEAGPVPAQKAAHKRASRKATAPVAAREPGPAIEPTDAAEPTVNRNESGDRADLAGANTAAGSTAAENTASVNAASVNAAAGSTAAEDIAAAEGDLVADPAAPVRRTRRSRAAAAPGAAPAPAPASASASALSPAGVEDTDPEEQTADVTDAGGTTDAGETTDAPSFGVLFQAPGPTTSRRRRASAPAAAPQLAAPALAGRADEPDEDPILANAGANAGADAEPADEPTPARTRRRRGGKRAGELENDRSTEGADDEASEGASAEGDEESSDGPRRRRRRGGKGRRGRAGDPDSGDEDTTDGQPTGGRGARRGAPEAADQDIDQVESGSDNGDDPEAAEEGEGGSRRRTRRRRRSGSSGDNEDVPGVVTRVREPRRERERGDEVTGLKGSTRLEAKKQRRREGREAGRRRTVITEAEFLARRESVERVMVVRTKGDRTQIGVLEDDVLVEHYISRETNVSMAGNIYLGRVQNVLPSMEAAFVDIGKGRNAVLYAGEVNWDAAGLENNQPKRIENALSSGESVLVQVTKDPIGHKGARLTSQVSLPGRYLVYVPDSSMTGISRKLPDTERARLKKILKEVVPESAGVIVRTAAEGASEEELRADVERLTSTWEEIRAKAESKGSGKGKTKGGGSAPLLLHGEPDLTVRVIRDVFNEDFTSLVVAGQQAWDEVSDYVGTVAPDLAERVTRWTSEEDLFTHYRVDEQIAKAMDRKVWLPSGGSLVIDRTEAMTVVDVNTGKFIGSGGNLEETVTKNNIEAAEEIVRQLRLRDIGGIIVVDFIDMVLESNRELVVRRLLECLGRDRTKHQVAEVTSLGLVQMTRKRVGSGLIEVFGETCEHCNGRGIIVHADPVDKGGNGHGEQNGSTGSTGSGRSSGSHGSGAAADPSTGRGGTRGRRGVAPSEPVTPPRSSGPTPAQIAAAAHAAALKSGEPLVMDASGPPAVRLAGRDTVAQDELALVGATVDDQPDGRELGFEVLAAEHGGFPGDAPGADPEAAVEVVIEAVVEASVERLAEPLAERNAEPVIEMVTEPLAEPVVERVAEPAAGQDGPPAGRGRRRRGRVVAPAGPPRGSGPDHAGG